jgi:hypothetical protein
MRHPLRARCQPGASGLSFRIYSEAAKQNIAAARTRGDAALAGGCNGPQTGRKSMEMISVGTFWTIWLLVHLLFAVELLGALTHQAMAVALPVRRAAGGIVTRFRAVPAPGYATAVCVLWVLTFIVGSFIYTKYRIFVRIPLEQSGYYKTQGFFDFKEHVATLGLVLLPGYWYLWKNAQKPEYDSARKMVTLVLAVMC